MQLKLLTSPWKKDFIDIISKTKEKLIISSPFITEEGVTILSNSMKVKSNIEILLITNFTSQNIINKATDPKALLKLCESFRRVKISSVFGLHAKVYLIDDKISIITSANLTNGGLTNNFEYGVLIDDYTTCCNIKADLLKYYSLGNMLDIELLQKINKEAEEIYKIKNNTDRLIEGSELGKLLKKRIEHLNTELLKNRLKEGKTINTIFSETILFLLKKKGPLNTRELHPTIQSIHPDICDDSIDRIINGQHFGKKWKHQVRSAQQSLKKKGLIYMEGRKWHLRNQ